MKITGGLKSSARREYWRDVIEKQVRSGQPARAFCVERGLTEQSFYMWKKRLASDAPVSFALVTPERSGGKQSVAMELELGSGERLRIPRDVDAATLRTVLSVLREQA
jgi:hypothetical protein